MVAALALMTACGGDNASDRIGGDAISPAQTEATDATEATEPAPAEAAYRAWLAALESHDPAGVCARHAPAFTIALRQQAILLQRASLGDPCTGFVAVLWEDPAREYRPTAIELTQLTEEDALLAVDFPKVDETVRMERRHGSWYVASTEPRGSDRSADSEPARWVRRWCELTVGMGRDRVIALMGEPSGEYTVENGGEPQLWWADRQYDFRAYLDSDDRVLDLVGDYDRLDAADRDLLGCPELR